MQTGRVAAAALILVTIAACGREPVGPEPTGQDRAQTPAPAPPPAAPAPSTGGGLYTDDLLVVDPAQLRLISTAAELEAGTYRYQVIGDTTPQVVPGTVLYGGGDQQYLRRVWQVQHSATTLTAQTTSAFPHEVIRAGRHSLRDGPLDGPANLGGSEYITVSDTFDIASDVCQLMADALVLIDVCGVDRTLISKGWIELEGRVDTLRILSGEVMVEGALDASYVVSPGGDIVPNTGRRPKFAPCDSYPDATGCFARVGTALRNFLVSVGADPNVLPPPKVCVPGTPVTIVPLRVFPFRPPTVRICRVTDWGALPEFTLPELSSVSLNFVPKITVTDMVVRALGSATLELTIPVPKLGVTKCFNHGNGFFCLKAGLVIVLSAGFVESGGTARLDGFHKSRVAVEWTSDGGWQDPIATTLESDRSFGFLPKGADTVNVRIGPSIVLEAQLCFGPNSKTACVDESTGTDEKSKEGWLLDLQIGGTGTLQFGTYLDAAWSRDTVYGNWHVTTDLLSEIEVEFGLILPKILVQLDKNLKTNIPPLQWGRTTMGSYHGTGLVKINTNTIDPPAGLADYTVKLERRDTFPVLEPAGTRRIGPASWESPLSATLPPTGSFTFDESPNCGVAYSDALIAFGGGTTSAALLKGARRLGLGIPNLQVELGCQILIADYVVTLEGVPDHCVVTDGAVQDLRLTQWHPVAQTERTTELDFEVDCSVPTGPPGDLQVSVNTSGTFLPSGYQLRLDGGTPVATDVDDVVTLTGIGSRPGRQLRLEEVPSYCSVTGGNPRSVDVIAGQVVTVQFDVSCAGVAGDAPPDPGTVVVRTVTLDGEPGNLSVLLDGDTPVITPAGDEVRFESVAAGQHVVSLSGLRADCNLIGSPSRTLSLTGGGEVVVTFEVECTGAEPGEATGSVHIAVGTSGWQVDPDGYQIRIGSFKADLAASDTLTVDQLAPGSAEVWLDGVSGNCQVEGGNPRAVSIQAGVVLQVVIEVACEPHAALWFTNTTIGEDPDPDGYTVVVNGTTSRAVATNSAVAVTGLVPGTAGVSLEGVAPNCTPLASFPQTVELEPGQTATMYIDVTCVALDQLGELEVTLRAWRGSLPDTSYALLIDGRERGTLLPGRTILLDEVIAGERGLEVVGLPEGWRITGESPKVVRVNGRYRARVVLWAVEDRQ